MFFWVQRAPAGSPKKYVAIFQVVGGSDVRVPFGQRGSMDYIKWYKQKGPKVAAERRRAYLGRHAAREDWSNPMTAGALARWLLWELPDFSEAAAAFARRFGLTLRR